MGCFHMVTPSNSKVSPAGSVVFMTQKVQSGFGHCPVRNLNATGRHLSEDKFKLVMDVFEVTHEHTEFLHRVRIYHCF